MKIIQIIGDSSVSGGPRHVLVLTKELEKRGLPQIVICPPGFLANKLEEAGIRVHKVKMHGPFDRQADHRIREILINAKPDLVHCHGVRGGWLGRLAARKIPNLPIVYTEHLWTKEYHLENPVWERFQLRGLKFLDKYTAKTIAVSYAVKKYLLERKITTPQKTLVIPNFLPVEIFELKSYKKPKSVGILIGSVGSLNPQKDFETLIKAAEVIHRAKRVIHSSTHFTHSSQAPKQLPIRFQIIGSGNLKNKLEKVIHRAKLQDIFHLRENVEDIYEAMRHFTIYVQPSISESFGLTAAEAMALQIPTVATNISAFRELIKPNQTGLLFPVKDYRRLAELLEILIKNSAFRLKLAKNASREVKKRYTIDKVIPQIIAVYEEIIKN